jgi:hypothetical protein
LSKRQRAESQRSERIESERKVKGEEGSFNDRRKQRLESTRDGEEMHAGVEPGEDLRGLEKPLRIYGEILVWTGVLWHRIPYTVSLQEYPTAQCDICKYANTGRPVLRSPSSRHVEYPKTQLIKGKVLVN